jgi:glycerophosphoryl diester phosphodiesterase
MRRLREWGVTGIITDRPDIALDVLADERAHP